MNIAMPPPFAYGVSHALTRTSIYLTAPCATVTPPRRPHASVARTTAEGQAAHKPHEYWAFRKPNAQVQRRRSEAQGTNTEGVGVRCNAQLGWWQDKDCEGSEPEHEATAWWARRAVMPASSNHIAMSPPLRMASAMR